MHQPSKWIKDADLLHDYDADLSTASGMVVLGQAGRS